MDGKQITKDSRGYSRLFAQWNVYVYIRQHDKRGHIRHTMRQNHHDYAKRGNGSKAWKRAATERWTDYI